MPKDNLKINSPALPALLREAQSKVTPKQYEVFLKQLKLLNIFTARIDVDRTYDASAILSEASPNLDIRKTAEFRMLSALKRTYGVNIYDITVKAGETVVLDASVEVVAEFSYESIPFDKNYFAIYDHLSLGMMLYPYARLLINRVLADANLGLFTLPMLKQFISSLDS